MKYPCRPQSTIDTKGLLRSLSQSDSLKLIQKETQNSCSFMSADAPVLGGELAGASFIASDKSENYSGVTISYYTDAYENYLAVRK